MFIRLLILFTLVPLIELYLLLQVGNRIGAFPTIAIILLTGAAGACHLLAACGDRVFAGALPAAPASPAPSSFPIEPNGGETSRRTAPPSATSAATYVGGAQP